MNKYFKLILIILIIIIIMINNKWYLYFYVFIQNVMFCIFYLYWYQLIKYSLKIINEVKNIKIQIQTNTYKKYLN